MWCPEGLIWLVFVSHPERCPMFQKWLEWERIHYRCILNRNGHLVLRRQKFCHSCPDKASHARTAKHGQVPWLAVESLPRDKGPISGTVCGLEPVLFITGLPSCQVLAQVTRNTTSNRWGSTWNLVLLLKARKWNSHQDKMKHEACLGCCLKFSRAEWLKPFWLSPHIWQCWVEHCFISCQCELANSL